MKKAPRQRGLSATAQTLEQKRKLLLMVPETIPSSLDTRRHDWAKEVFAILDAALEEARKNPVHKSRARDFIDGMAADGYTPRHDLEHETEWFARMAVEKNLPDLPPLPELPSWAERWVTQVTTNAVLVSAVSASRTYKSWDAHVDQSVFFDRHNDGSIDVEVDPPRVVITADDDDQTLLTTNDTVEIARVIVAAGVDLAKALSDPNPQANSD